MNPHVPDFEWEVDYKGNDVPCKVEIDTLDIVKADPTATNPFDYNGYADVVFRVILKDGTIIEDEDLDDRSREAIKLQILDRAYERMEPDV